MISFRIYVEEPSFFEFSCSSKTKVRDFLSLVEEKTRCEVGVIQRLGLFHFGKRIDISHFGKFIEEIDSLPLFPHGEIANIYVGFENYNKLFEEMKDYKHEPRNFEKKCIEFKTSDLTEAEIKFIHVTIDHFLLRVKKMNGERILQVYTKQYEKIPKGISEVIEGFLYIGSMRDARDIEELKRRGIFRVLNISNWKRMKYDQRIFTVKRINIEDTESVRIFHLFEEANNWIDRASTPVLVHCVVGKSRSASFVIAYLMRKYRMDLKSAFTKLKQSRDLIRPNDGFLGELRKYEQLLYGEECEESLNIETDLPSDSGRKKNRKSKKRKKKEEPVDEKIRELVNLIISEKEVLERIVREECQDVYSNKNYKLLVSSIRSFIKGQKSSIMAMNKGLKWSLFERQALIYARKWYAKKIKEREEEQEQD